MRGSLAVMPSELAGFRKTLPRGSKRVMFLILEDMTHVAFASPDDLKRGWGVYEPDYAPGALASDSEADSDG
jgi:hypothetical protein